MPSGSLPLPPLEVLVGSGAAVVCLVVVGFSVGVWALVVVGFGGSVVGSTSAEVGSPPTFLGGTIELECAAEVRIVEEEEEEVDGVTA